MRKDGSGCVWKNRIMVERDVCLVNHRERYREGDSERGSNLTKSTYNQNRPNRDHLTL